MGTMDIPQLETAWAELKATLDKSDEIVDKITPLIQASAILAEYATELADNKETDRLLEVVRAISYLMELASNKMPSQVE